MKFYVCWIVFSLFVEIGMLFCQQTGFGYIPSKPMSHEELRRIIPGSFMIVCFGTYFFLRSLFKK